MRLVNFRRRIVRTTIDSTCDHFFILQDSPSNSVRSMRRLQQVSPIVQLCSTFADAEYSVPDKSQKTKAKVE